MSRFADPSYYREINPGYRLYSIEKYQARIEDITLDHEQVKAAENTLKSLLGESWMSIQDVGEKECRELLEQFLSKVDLGIRENLEWAGFKSVSKHSGYDYLRAKQKLVVLSDYFLRDRIPDPLNIAGNIKYRSRTERLEFSSLRKVSFTIRWFN